MQWNRLPLLAGVLALSMASACGEDSDPERAHHDDRGPPGQRRSAETPSADEQLDTLRPMLTVKNGTSDQATGARTTASSRRPYTGTFNSAVTAFSSSPAGFAVMVGKTGVPESAAGRTSFQPDQDLQPSNALLLAREGRAGHRAIGLVGGVTTFTDEARWLQPRRRALRSADPRRDCRRSHWVHRFHPWQRHSRQLEHELRAVLLPATISNGEFSMEIEGLHPDFPGDKTKLFGMQEGQDDYITNRTESTSSTAASRGSPRTRSRTRVLYGDDPCCKATSLTPTRLPIRVRAQSLDYRISGSSRGALARKSG